ncbi:MAG: hypothetical protein EHM72_19315, partial [Calditrichaeota bacterium]
DGVDNDGNGKIDDVRGWDFVKNTTDAASSEDGQTEDNDPKDGHGHGTHVAGLASAVTNNGVGVAGIGWGCEIMPLRVGYKNRSNGGSILSAVVLDAIDYAVVNGADVINTSFGGIGNDFSIRDMMRYAFDNGVVSVVSAGNNGSNIGYSPENEDYVISVAAVDFNDRKTSYSNFGPWVKISAPGGTSADGIYSTHLNNKYSSLMGTSMATPIVSGTAALVRSIHPDWSAAQVMMHVIDTADDINAANPLYTGQMGVVGRVNAGRALSSPFQSQPKFSIARILVEDLASGNGDKRANIGETADLNIKLVNRRHDARNVRLQLTSSDPQVTVLVPDLTFTAVAGISSSRNYVETIDPYLRIKVSDIAFPHNVEFTLTITADGGFVQTLPFHLAIEARVLVVDDDDGFNNVEQYYFSVLDSLGMPYDVWDRSRQGRTGTNLKNYHLVIWFCENAFPTLDSSDRDDLIAYLRADRYLFISGQNIAWDLGFTLQTAEDAESRSYYNQYRQVGDATERFLKNQLHTIYVEDKTAEAIVKGVETLPLSRGLEFVFASPLRQPTEQSPDVINTTLGSSVLFKYQDGPAAAVVYKGAHQVVYWAFGGLEAVVDAAKRQTAMSRILTDFTGMEVKVDKLSNIENEVENIQVRAIVNRQKNLAGVNLYWRQLSQPQFQQLAMTAVNDSLFTAEIPRQSFGTELEYAVQAVAADGLYSPVKLMRVKIESSAPIVAAVIERKANLSLSPFVTMTASDLSGVDSSS